MQRELRLKCYQRDSDKRLKVEETVEYILDNFSYGDTITDDDLCYRLGYNIEITEEFKKYKSMMQKIKEELMTFNYILKSISHVGYYILKPEHIVGHCYNTYVKRSQRTLDKSLKVSCHIDKTNLSENRLEEIENFRDLNAQLVNNMEELINNSKYFDRLQIYGEKDYE